MRETSSAENVAVIGRASDRPIAQPRPALGARLQWSPFVLRRVGKHAFPLITRMLAEDDVLFLNWGYEEDPPTALPLADADEPNRYPIQLYHRTATQADLVGKRVLEVSCGHGGGAAYLVRTMRPTHYTAVDSNRAGIDFCRTRHHLPDLDFVHGDAVDLPLPTRSFDAVVNIESAHLYSSFPRFLAEVARVLVLGGHFLYADLRPRHQIAAWEAALADAPLRMVSHEVINVQVLRGNERNPRPAQDLVAAAVARWVSRRMPSFMGGMAREATGVEGSQLHRAMQSGELSYRLYNFVKE